MKHGYSQMPSTRVYNRLSYIIQRIKRRLIHMGTLCLFDIITISIAYIVKQPQSFLLLSSGSRVKQDTHSTIVNGMQQNTIRLNGSTIRCQAQLCSGITYANELSHGKVHQHRLRRSYTERLNHDRVPPYLPLHPSGQDQCSACL